MKRLIFTFLFILSFAHLSRAQVGIGTENPHNSAALEISAIDKGLLISRLSKAERIEIQSPAVGLLVYQLDDAAGFYYFNGEDWVILKTIFQENADWNSNGGASEILNKPELSAVGLSGEFSDLKDIPALIYVSDTSKMLISYLTAEKLVPYLEVKADKEALLQEIDRAKTAEEKLANDLAAETTRATAAEGELQTNIETVQDNVDSNKTATDEAIALKEDAANKSTDVTLADETNTKFPTELAVKTFVNASASEGSAALAEEIDRAKTAEEKLAEDLTTETTRATTAEGELQTNIETVQDNVDSNKTATDASIALKENSANKSTDVTLADESDTKFPTEHAVKTYVDGKVSGLSSNAESLQTELDATQTGAGLGTDGSYTANTESNFLKTATSLKDASEKLDTQVKTNADGIATNSTNISANTTDISGLDTKVTQNTTDIETNSTNIALKENSANKSTDVTLADETDTKFPTEKAVKAYVDAKEINLSSNATGVLPITNGGTGSETQNFVDLTADQTIEGNKSLISDLKVSGITVGVGGGAPTSAAYNTALGLDALVNNTGWGNTAIGRETLTVNENSNNTAVGYRALKESLHGNSLVAVGSSALLSNTEGNVNTALGASSLGNNTMGSENTAVGGNTLMTNILGNQNTALGRYADVSFDGLSNATAIGFSAKVDASNTIQLGNIEVTDVKTTGKLTTGAITLPNTDGLSGQVLKTDGDGLVTWATPTTATSSDFVDLTTAQTVEGAKSFRSDIKVNGLTIGKGIGEVNDQNITVGENTLVKNTTGQLLIAIGNNALSNNTSANYNIGIGASALSANIIGTNNLAIGGAALFRNLGSDNTAIGRSALLMGNSLNSVTGLGFQAGMLNTGSSNTFLGANTDQNSASSSMTNATAIGYGAKVATSNTIQLGNTAITDVKTSGKLTTGAITLPNSDGTTGQVLSTNGDGLVTWVTPSSTTSSDFVDLTTDQSIEGAKSFTSEITVNGQKLGSGGNNDNSNIAFGSDALTENLNGFNNTALGVLAMKNNTNGSMNTAVGNGAMYYNTTGIQNTVTGRYALFSNTEGTDNTGIGFISGSSISTGSKNTMIGSSTNGTATIENATAIGYGATVSTDNTIQLGNNEVTDVKTEGKLTTGAITLPNSDGTTGQVLSTNGDGVVTWVTPSTATSSDFVDLSTAQTVAGAKTFSSDMNVNGVKIGRGLNNKINNTALGFEVLNSNTSGISNTGLGYRVLTSNTSGVHNTALGFEALSSNTSGGWHTALGSEALKSNTTGIQNTGIGYQALSSNTSGGFNTGIGYQALLSNTSGAFNTGIGYQALLSNTTGGRNTAIGYMADVSIGSLGNATAIGNGAIVSSSNTIQLGNTDITDVKTSGKLTTGAITLPNSDGTTGQVLSTNGAGIASWITPASAPSIQEVADEFTAFDSQTNFTLTQTPATNSKVKMYINGIRISNLAYSWTGDALTYDPTKNGNHNLSAEDRIQFDYFSN